MIDELRATSTECPLQTETVFATTHKKLEALEVEVEVDSARFLAAIFVVLYSVLSRLVSCLSFACLAFPCVLSWLVLFCLVLCCVLLCLGYCFLLPCLVLSCLACAVLLCFVLFYLVLFCVVLCCLVLSCLVWSNLGCVFDVFLGAIVFQPLLKRKCHKRRSYKR